MRLASLQVEVNARKSERIGSSTAPIDILQPDGARCDSFFDGQVSVLLKPGIQVHAAFERTETVIREDKQSRLRVDKSQRRSEQLIHPAVQIFDNAYVLSVPARALRFQEAIEHVLHAITGVEDTREDAPVHSFQSTEEHALAFCVEIVRLL